MLIRSAEATDAPLISRMAGEIWHICYATILKQEQINYMLRTLYDIDLLAGYIRSGSQPFLILYDENVPVGFAGYSLLDRAAAKLNKLYVMPAEQKKGYGHALLNAVAERAKEWNCDTLVLNVNRYNPAYYFYLKEGFTVLREEDIPIGEYWMNDYVMGKKIG